MVKKIKEKGKRIKKNLSSASETIFKALEKIITHIPKTKETKNRDPRARSRKIINNASLKAGGVAGGLALPSGPVGMLTIIPDLITIWRIQRKLVVDIAGAYGKQGSLTKEQMIYCLFKHSAGQVTRDFAVRVGTHMVFKRVSQHFIERSLKRIGIKLTQTIGGRVVARWMPVVGAVGIGAYAYYDTASVGKTAIDLFSSDIEIETKKIDNNKPTSQFT